MPARVILISGALIVVATLLSGCNKATNQGFTRARLVAEQMEQEILNATVAVSAIRVVSEELLNVTKKITIGSEERTSRDDGEARPEDPKKEEKEVKEEEEAPNTLWGTAWSNISNGTELPPYGPYDIKEQAGALIRPGEGDFYLYAIGSSSLVWMTWVDQLHLYLKRLGYTVGVVPAKTKAEFVPRSVPTCDDTKWFEPLKTARFGRIGWSSWDFAYEGWGDCVDGFRNVSNVWIKCQHGPGCHFSPRPYPLSLIAEDAGKSNVTVLTTWFNDDQQGWGNPPFKCFNGTKVDGLQTANMSTLNIVRTIRSIHQANPNTWVLVMSKYPQCYLHTSPRWFRKLNAIMKDAVEKEPKTLFVDYYMPPDYVANMYQVAHQGHPNCRGSKVMAHAVIRRLYEAKVISRSLDFHPKEATNHNCSTLVGAACHSSSLCWVEPVNGTCAPYSPGSKHWHVVK